MQVIALLNEYPDVIFSVGNQQNKYTVDVLFIN